MKTLVLSFSQAQKRTLFSGIEYNVHIGYKLSNIVKALAFILIYIHELIVHLFQANNTKLPVIPQSDHPLVQWNGREAS